MRAHHLQPHKQRVPPPSSTPGPVRPPLQSSHGGAPFSENSLSSLNGSRCSTHQRTIIHRSGKRSQQKNHIPKTSWINSFIHSPYNRTRHPPIAHRRLRRIVKVFWNDRSTSPTNYFRGQLTHNKIEHVISKSLYSAKKNPEISEERDEVITIVFHNRIINTPNAKILCQTNSSRTLVFPNIERKFRDLYYDRYIKYSRKNVSSSVNHFKTFCLFPPREHNNTIDDKILRDRHNYGAFSKSVNDAKEGKILILSLYFCDKHTRFVHRRCMKNFKLDFQITYLNSVNSVSRTRNAFLCSLQRKLQTNENNNFNISKSSCTRVFQDGDIHANIAVNLVSDIVRQDDRDTRPALSGGTAGSIQSSCDIYDRLAGYSGVGRYQSTESRVGVGINESMDEWRKEHKRRYHQDGRKKDRGHRRPWYRRWSGWWALLLSLSMTVCAGGTSLPLHKYSTRVVRTKYGPLRGIIVHAHPPVEAFLGVPYATPPLGSLRCVTNYLL